ncbi:hypothetical protein BD289DRAFT_478421 [Coniella lustricola]|uniref:Uncharacterized protein n=1 Tax=Coniella lustricola TaxID=2025994 RepID=A0A2T3AMM6_9PEZI|nr:hypothetical protein BD289DRAFT_478421 [Coniella lustricola]
MARNSKSKKNKAIVNAWKNYMIDESLEENWQRFLHDLGLGDFKSKSQCKKALRSKWINIHDFLAAVEERDKAVKLIVDEALREEEFMRPVNVTFFKSERALAQYTLTTQKIFPRSKIAKESPLKLLLANIL